MGEDAKARTGTVELVRSLVAREAIDALLVRSNGPASWHLLGHLLAVLLSGALVALAGGSWLVLPAMFVLGVVLTHLFAPQHECAHFSAFRSRRLNEWVAWACGAVIIVPEVHFRYEHHHHHSFTNLHRQDPELIPMPTSVWGYLWYLSAIPYWWGSWSGITRRSFGHLTDEEQRFIPLRDRRRVAMEARVLALAYGLVAGVWTENGPRALRMAKSIRAGQVFLNNYGAGGGVELPFGGFGHSGHGREKGFEALYGFSTIKTVAAFHG